MNVKFSMMFNPCALNHLCGQKRKIRNELIALRRPEKNIFNYLIFGILSKYKKRTKFISGIRKVFNVNERNIE